MSWSTRRIEPEVMDQPGLDPQAHSQALAGLRRINWFSGTASLLWREIRGISRQRALRSVQILDLACGGGDLSLRLARRAADSDLNVAIHGWDRSPTAIEFASRQARRERLENVQFFERDVLNDPIEESCDIVICTLFLHHLQEDDALRLMERMRRTARVAVLIDDLRRSRTGYALAWAGCRILSRSPVVHADGPMSVRAAFRPDEVRILAERAGLIPPSIRRHWPQRFLLNWTRP